MERRQALKNIGLAAGFFVATPSILTLMQSCKSDVAKWVPEFLSTDQSIVLKNMVDIILPKTEDLPSASELNVPEFIDKFLNEVLDEEEQGYVKTAFENLVTMIKPDAETSWHTITKEDYTAILDKHMRVKDEIDEEREANPESLAPTKSEFLNSLKWLTIEAYTTTEKIGEEVLVYDPVPAAYYCGDLQELTGGKSYSL